MSIVIWGIIKFIVVLSIVSVYVLFMTWFDRKVIARMQNRVGPKLIGFHGLWQPLADAIKSLWKEDTVPDKSYKFMFWLAPIISITTAFAISFVIPFAPPIKTASGIFHFSVAHLNVAILFVFAFLGLSSYGVLYAGISSGGSKYPFIGAQREGAQMISYEIILALSILNPILMSQSLNFETIVAAQTHHLWYVFYQPVAFITYLIAMFAVAGKVPFDLPEAESEICCGYFVEYSGMKMGLFPFAQYIVVLVLSAIMVLLFLGGWTGPFWSGGFFAGLIWYWIKVAFFIFLFTWAWATFPRYRYDQLMDIGWKILLPIAVLNIFWTGFALTVGLPFF